MNYNGFRAKPMTAEDITDYLKKIDRLLRPKALILSPQMKRSLLEVYPEIEKEVLLMEADYCEPNTAYLIDRKHIEEYVPEFLPFDFGGENK